MEINGLLELEEAERGKGRERGRVADFEGFETLEDVLDGEVLGEEEFKEAENGIELLLNCRGMFWMLGMFFDDKY